MKDIKKWMLKNKVRYIVLFNGEKPDSNLFYLSNYTGYGSLVIPAKEKPFLYIPEMEMGKAEEKGIKTEVANKKLFEILKKGKIGLDFEAMSFNQIQSLKKKYKRKFVDVSNFIKEKRKVKTDEEISKIRKACEITDDILRKLILNWDFKTEEETAAFLIKETRLRNCELAFEPIVASGKNASVPHHIASGKMERGFCVIDFGVKYKGYCSDETRTIYLGEPSEEDIDFYKKILGLQIEIVEKTKKDEKCRELHEEVKRKLKENFIHALGHGVGIDVHESPTINSASEEVLKENMIVAIEPGFYVKNEKGIRIEDTVLIGKENNEILTNFTKDLIIITRPKASPKIIKMHLP